MNEDFDLQDLLSENEEDNDTETPTTLSLDLIKEQFPKYTIQKVAEMVVVARYLGLDNAITVACMEELATRRAAGDNFPFETFIEESYNKLPTLSFTMPDLRTALTQFVKQDAKK